MCASGLFAIDGVKSGIDPQTDGSPVETPGGDVLFEGEIIAKDGYIRGEEDKPSNEGDDIRCDPHGHQCNNIIPIRCQ